MSYAKLVRVSLRLAAPAVTSGEGVVANAPRSSLTLLISSSYVLLTTRPPG
jgi:hypothetical protein